MDSGKRILTVIAAALACAPAPAQAGTYTVWSCRGPAGEPLSASAWSLQTVSARPGDVQFADTCAQRGKLRVALAADRAFDDAATAMAEFAAPAGTRIVGYDVWRSLAVAPPRLLAAYDYAALVAVARGGASSGVGCTTWQGPCETAGDPTHPLADVNRVGGDGQPADAVRLQVSCRRSYCRPTGRTPASAELYRARVVVEDRLAPAVPKLARERTTVTVSSTDAGGGIASISAAVDGGSPSVWAADCREPYTSASPCPGRVEHSFSASADGLRPGEHSFSGTVTDAAGNVTAWGPVPFTVSAPPASPSAPPPASRPAPPPAAVASASVSGRPAAARLRLSARATRAQGRKARLTGTLRTAGGAPISGARLTARAEQLGVAKPRRFSLKPVRTDARGRFELALRRDGAHRVTVTYAPERGGPRATAAVSVRTRLSLTASPDRSRLVKGRVLTLKGRIRGAGASAKGVPVRIESIVNGEWTAVGAVKTRADGRYRWRYRFVHLMRDTRFSFRAVVDSAPGWPWRQVRSARRLVDVDIP